MKNIHMLPTTQDSWLCLKDGELVNANDGGCMLGYDPPRWLTQHIYITSNEEIKEGDWVYTPNKTIMLVTVKYSTESSFIIGNNNEKSSYYIEFCKKIILTTDIDLINDGVQAIDNEFLEWFVNNANESGVPFDRCEVKKEMYTPQINGKISDGKITHELSLDPSQNTIPYYKIIIPKEEPKDVVLGYKTSLDAQMLDKVGLEEPNEEAIKEALERVRRTPMTFVPDKIMYSEEETFDLLLRAKVETVAMYYEEMKEWFEQVKKK